MQNPDRLAAKGKTRVEIQRMAKVNAEAKLAEAKERVKATLQLMEVQLTTFPGVEYDGKLLKARFDAMLDNYVQHIRSRVVEGHQRLLARGPKLENAARCGADRSAATLGSKANFYGVGYTGLDVQSQACEHGQVDEHLRKCLLVRSPKRDSC